MSNKRPEVAKLRKTLATLQQEVKEFYHKFRKETDLQDKITDRMYMIAQRFNLLVKGVPCKRTYPIEASNAMEDIMKTDFHSQLGIVDESNSMLTSILSNLKQSYNVLDKYLENTDISKIESLTASGIKGPTIAQQIELLMDFQKHFSRTVSQLNSSALLLKIDNVKSIEDYKTILILNPVFHDYLQTSLALAIQSQQNIESTKT